MLNQIIEYSTDCFQIVFVISIKINCLWRRHNKRPTTKK